MRLQDAEKKDVQHNGNRAAGRVNRFAYPLILAGSPRRIRTQFRHIGSPLPTSHVILSVAKDLCARRVRPFPFAEFPLERSEGLRAAAHARRRDHRRHAAWRPRARYIGTLRGRPGVGVMHKPCIRAKGPILRGTGKPLCEVLLYSSLYPVRRINDISFFPSLKTTRIAQKE